MIYKVITKILSNHLKGLLDPLIHPNQATFIPKRSIVDNGIINREVMYYLKSRKGLKYFMAIKVDMTKAYDMVEWDVVIAILRKHGFCDEFCDMIKECMSSAWFSILINGSPHGFFYHQEVSAKVIQFPRLYSPFFLICYLEYWLKHKWKAIYWTLKYHVPVLESVI